MIKLFSNLNSYLFGTNKCLRIPHKKVYRTRSVELISSGNALKLLGRLLFLKNKQFYP